MMKMKNGIVAAIVVLSMFMMLVCVPISDETYAETEFEAMIGDVGYSTLEEAMEEANKAEEPVVVEIQKDCTIESKVLVNKTMTIDGNGYTITGTNTKHMFRIGESETEIEIVDVIFKDITIVNESSITNNSCINTRDFAGSLTMQKVDLESNNSYNDQPLTIGTSHKITVDIDGCNISASGSGYAIITFIECDISITNSGLSGYSCVYIKSGSDNSTIIVKNSIMNGTNSYDGDDNNFGTIVIENYGQSLDNISIFIDESSEICSTKNGEASTSAIHISGSSVLPENYNIFLGKRPVLNNGAVESMLITEDIEKLSLEETNVVIDGEIVTYYMVKGSNPDAIYGFLGGSSSVEIDSDGEDSVMIPVVGTIDGNVDFDYDIVLPSGTVSIPSSVLTGLSDGATSVGVSMEAIELPPEYSYLPMGSVAYDVSVLIDDAPIHDLGGKIVVYIDASLPSRVIHILGNGLVEYPAFGIDDDGKLFIELTSLSDIVLDYTVDDDEEDFIPTAPSTGSGDSGDGDDTTLYVACVAAAAVVAVLAILALTTNRN